MASEKCRLSAERLVQRRAWGINASLREAYLVPLKQSALVHNFFNPLSLPASCMSWVGVDKKARKREKKKADDEMGREWSKSEREKIPATNQKKKNRWRGWRGGGVPHPKRK